MGLYDYLKLYITSISSHRKLLICRQNVPQVFIYVYLLPKMAKLAASHSLVIL